MTTIVAGSHYSERSEWSVTGCILDEGEDAAG